MDWGTVLWSTYLRFAALKIPSSAAAPSSMALICPSAMLRKRNPLTFVSPNRSLSSDRSITSYIMFPSQYYHPQVSIEQIRLVRGSFSSYRDEDMRNRLRSNIPVLPVDKAVFVLCFSQCSYLRCLQKSRVRKPILRRRPCRKTCPNGTYLPPVE